MLRFVSKDSAINAVLSTVVDELTPNKHGVGCGCSQDDLFAWADKQLSLPSIGVPIAAVVPFVEVEAVKVAILCQPPNRVTWEHLTTKFLLSRCPC